MIALVYHSSTGNTSTLADWIEGELQEEAVPVVKYSLENFPLELIPELDGLILGTYTWGSGDLPKQLYSITEAVKKDASSTMVTAAFGTGDSFYPHFCGAVDKLKELFYVHTDLAVTLKVELLPQEADRERCRKFAGLVKKRLHMQSRLHPAGNY
ncbi:flavodoxin domain-containing protein [Alkalicoccus daliensis]|uniref:Flavodoxin I n=1 Tax=Alkalicoccus daliensis TaxID=745820 RepID=A0A1H0DRK0_9BACI|nr:flavodoxin domain-containing protein [Alkalicoccus daliensis]SDN72784.1 flavodoxin I [Alkalicoccus daliensis]